MRFTLFGACVFLLLTIHWTSGFRLPGKLARHKINRTALQTTESQQDIQQESPHEGVQTEVPRDAADEKNNTAGKLDIVLTHYSKDTLEETATWWLGFLNIDMVRALKPAVYVYCQNPNISDLSPLEPLLEHGGKLEHLDNLGRESHAFLTHITRYYDALPDHVLFSQDIPVDVKLWHRFQKMFVPETGFLPLAIVGHQDCEDGWLPRGLMIQLYAIFTKEICPPQGFTAAFNGQFLVSRKRLLDIEWWTYKHLLDLVSAPRSHWIHDAHNDTYYKNPDNPMFGHVVERSWSLAFRCYDSWRASNCYGCDHHRGMVGCGTDCCQCFDLQE